MKIRMVQHRMRGTHVRYKKCDLGRFAGSQDVRSVNQYSCYDSKETKLSGLGLHTDLITSPIVPQVQQMEQAILLDLEEVQPKHTVGNVMQVTMQRHPSKRIEILSHSLAGLQARRVCNPKNWSSMIHIIAMVRWFNI